MTLRFFWGGRGRVLESPLLAKATRNGVPLQSFAPVAGEGTCLYTDKIKGAERSVGPTRASFRSDVSNIPADGGRGPLQKLQFPKKNPDRQCRKGTGGGHTFGSLGSRRANVGELLRFLLLPEQSRFQSYSLPSVYALNTTPALSNTLVPPQ